MDLFAHRHRWRAPNSGCPVSQGTTVAVTPSTCRVTMEATPPAGFTAPSARIFNVGTGTSTGTADSAAPYIPSTTVSVGTYQLAIRWTQSGVTTVTYPTQTVKCGG